MVKSGSGAISGMASRMKMTGSIPQVYSNSHSAKTQPPCGRSRTRSAALTALEACVEAYAETLKQRFGDGGQSA